MGFHRNKYELFIRFWLVDDLWLLPSPTFTSICSNFALRKLISFFSGWNSVGTRWQSMVFFAVFLYGLLDLTLLYNPFVVLFLNFCISLSWSSFCCKILNLNLRKLGFFSLLSNWVLMPDHSVVFKKKWISEVMANSCIPI